MESRVPLTAEKHRAGCNCAQAVLCTYADRIGVDEETAFRMGAGLGLGMGGMEGTCGALTAACILVGAACTASAENPSGKAASHRTTRNLVADFAERAGATQCRQLKGRDTGVALCSCPDCIRIAAELVEQHVFS